MYLFTPGKRPRQGGSTSGYVQTTSSSPPSQDRTRANQIPSINPIPLPSRTHRPASEDTKANINAKSRLYKPRAPDSTRARKRARARKEPPTLASHERNHRPRNGHSSTNLLLLSDLRLHEHFSHQQNHHHQHHQHQRLPHRTRRHPLSRPPPPPSTIPHRPTRSPSHRTQRQSRLHRLPLGRLRSRASKAALHRTAPPDLPTTTLNTTPPNRSPDNDAAVFAAVDSPAGYIANLFAAVSPEIYAESA